MLQELVLSPPVVLPAGDVPPMMQPLADAAANSLSLAPPLSELVRRFGFDGFTYGAGTTPTLTRESRTYVWTSLPSEWVKRYDEKAYIEVDPRVTDAVAHSTPFLWDRSSFRDTKQRRAFFDDAARYGVCSGLAVGLRDKTRALAGFYLTSARPSIDDAERVRLREIEGDILLLAHYVHAVIAANIIEKGLPAPASGAALSARERECLQLAAKGLSSSRIGQMLGIAGRTVDFPHRQPAIQAQRC